MDNLIAFLRMFFSYLLVVAVAAAVIALAIFIGIRLRNSKKLKESVSDAEGSQTED